ncbi:hypothetical protein IFM89_029417 [Coptis chinensis]|uniref:Uncharacterized protein n=1 Tax=Coptis chinensis TaxID=261450 RepID=A0A835M732_9MAGN|nr:hypothetical protein IFM89_029417 [Coptis chinensis]
MHPSSLRVPEASRMETVEFCPHDSFHHVLAVSTYTLQEGDHPNRSGSISLFAIDAHQGNLDLFHHVETVGISDIKWNPIGANVVPLLASSRSLMATPE